MPVAESPEKGPEASSCRSRLELVGLSSAAAIVSINIWTGAPLLALWVGARAVPHLGLSIGAVAIVIVTMAVFEWALVKTLTLLNNRYDRVTGAPARRRTSPWLRSIRGEREEGQAKRQKLSTVELMLVVNVVVAVVALEIWFFFFAKMPEVGGGAYY